MKRYEMESTYCSASCSDRFEFIYDNYSVFVNILKSQKFCFIYMLESMMMGHSDISVTMNVYTHIGFDDAEEELKRMEEFRKAQAEVEKKNEKPMSQKMFKAI